ncbi:MAG: substrate-binding domain-containing protein [Dehalococcoidia bacterium]
MDAGHGVDRRLVMHNDFVVVGPSATWPAGSLPCAGAALVKLAQARATFVSRGDNSGTHALEQKLWRDASIDPKGQPWYVESGTGMGQRLQIAAERRVHNQRPGTYLAQGKNLKLDVLSVQGDAALLNIYHVIRVNPNKGDKINAAGAQAFADFMVAPATQKLIGEYGKAKFVTRCSFLTPARTPGSSGREFRLSRWTQPKRWTCPGDIVAFVGGGRQNERPVPPRLRIGPPRVAGAAERTTRFTPPEGVPPRRSWRLEARPPALLPSIPAVGLIVAAGYGAKGDSQPITPEWVEDFHRRYSGWTIVLEADGSAMRPLESAGRPRAGRAPVRLPGGDRGRPRRARPDASTLPTFTDPSWWRPSPALPLGAPVNEALMASVLGHPDGGRRGVPPGARWAVMLNKADSGMNAAGAGTGRGLAHRRRRPGCRHVLPPRPAGDRRPRVGGAGAGRILVDRRAQPAGGSDAKET